MFRRVAFQIKLLAFAGICLLLVTGPAGAQQGWPINGSNWSFYGGRAGGSSSYSPPYYSRPAMPYVGYSYAPASTEYYYNGVLTNRWASSANYSYGAYAPTQTNAAHIRLVVPGDARVWFDNKETKQTGETRLFESPALAPGHQYVYDVKVRWRDKDGQEVTRTRQLNVSANDNVSIDFTRQ
jgi:uncharacterized protein (TIGR03000 family)